MAASTRKRSFPNQNSDQSPHITPPRRAYAVDLPQLLRSRLEDLFLKRHVKCATALIASAYFWASLFGAQTAAAQQQPESPNELVVMTGKSVIVNSALPIERVSV